MEGVTSLCALLGGFAIGSGVTEGGQRGQLPPGAAGKGAQNSLAKNVL